MRLLVVLGVFVIGLFNASESLAKMISMAEMNKNSLSDACRRAGFRVLDFGTAYGCASSTMSIVCGNGRCEASIGDLIPIRGNSMTEVLGAMGTDLPARLVPLDARVGASEDARAGQTVRSNANAQRIPLEAAGNVPQGLQVPPGIVGRVGAGSAPLPSSAY
jgi:hypothetical protein